MHTKSLIDISKKEKTALWNKFEHEDTLLSELEFYQDKVKSMNRSATVLDTAVLTIFKHHIKNIENLLSKLYGSNAWHKIDSHM